ncbi:hypothetical protein [Klebsiella pneumoniae]|nr:hypothetical protein [Klebsiella pneumoniae]MEE2282891.1 hypothetical protein [Klebsiella pneumoniae]
MAVDSMKGRKLIGIYQPLPGVEAYVLKSKEGSSSKYVILAWLNNSEMHSHKSVILGGISGSVDIEHWNLDVEKNVNMEKGIQLDDQPIAIYTDSLPSWVNTNMKSTSTQPDEQRALKSHAPMPTDR